MNTSPADGNWSGLAEQIRRASSAGGRSHGGKYALEGTRLHERALRAGVVLQGVLVARSLADRPDERHRALLGELTQRRVPLLVAPDAVVAELTGNRGSGALVGLAALPGDEAWAAAGRESLLLVAIDVDDPGNVGALVRTAHASGADLFVAVGLTDPFHPRAVRTSMGSLFKLPVVRVAEYESAAVKMVAAGLTRCAAVLQGGEPLDQARLEGGLALHIGSEAFGLDAALVAGLDRRLTIPMPSSVDSYSVNAAAAILLWESARQRGRRSPTGEGEGEGDP